MAGRLTWPSAWESSQMYVSIETKMTDLFKWLLQGQSLPSVPREASLAQDGTDRCQSDEIITGNETTDWEGHLAGDAETFGEINKQPCDAHPSLPACLFELC